MTQHVKQLPVNTKHLVRKLTWPVRPRLTALNAILSACQNCQQHLLQNRCQLLADVFG